MCGGAPPWLTMPPRVTSPSSRPSRPLRSLLAVAVVVLAGVFAFLVTVNRTAVPGAAPSASRPPVVRVVAPSPTLSLDDVARAALSRTVTIEALGSNDEGLGTGWLIDTKGDFVTNAHVVQGQLSVRIRGRDGSSHVGDVMGIDRDLDIAVIRSRDGFGGAPLPTFSGTISDFPSPVVAIASSHATGPRRHHRRERHPHRERRAGDRRHHHRAAPDHHRLPRHAGARRPDHLPRQQRRPGARLASGRVVGIVTLASKSQPEGYAIQLNRVLAELISFAAK